MSLRLAPACASRLRTPPLMEDAVREEMRTGGCATPGSQALLSGVQQEWSGVVQNGRAPQHCLSHGETGCCDGCQARSLGAHAPRLSVRRLQPRALRAWPALLRGEHFPLAWVLVGVAHQTKHGRERAMSDKKGDCGPTQPPQTERRFLRSLPDCFPDNVNLPPPSRRQSSLENCAVKHRTAILHVDDESAATWMSALHSSTGWLKSVSTLDLGAALGTGRLPLTSSLHARTSKPPDLHTTRLGAGNW